ncbi:MAG: archaetidylserine decarboxylase [Myxococcota bacterium]|nr:archaetidylserine decarboxylase [Myxococcota bacterium]
MTTPDNDDMPTPVPSRGNPLQSGFVVDLTRRLPQAMVSRAWGWLARRKHPKLGVALLKRTFVRATGIDMSEAQEPIGTYSTLEDLFVRHLKTGARRIEPQPDAVVSPVDGTVGEVGLIEDGTLMQVKGRSYSLARLLDDEEEAKRFEGGAYATLYLAPHDYHRIHAPVSGSISQGALVPGALFPVFREALERIDELFARNERIITYIDNKTCGRVAVVKVGATLVGRISLAYDDSVHTNVKGQARAALRYDPAHAMQKGAELGAFELGSTVILVCEEGRISLEELAPGRKVKMGQRIGTLSDRPRTKRSRTRKSSES